MAKKEKDLCPFTAARIATVRDDANGNKIVETEIFPAPVVLSRTLYEDLPGFRSSERLDLRRWVADMMDLGSELPVLTPGIEEQHKDEPAPTIDQGANRLLAWMARNRRSRKDPFLEFDFTKDTIGASHPACLVTEMESRHGLLRPLKRLQEGGYVDFVDSEKQPTEVPGLVVRLTSAGLEQGGQPTLDMTGVPPSAGTAPSFGTTSNGALDGALGLDGPANEDRKNFDLVAFERQGRTLVGAARKHLDDPQPVVRLVEASQAYAASFQDSKTVNRSKVEKEVGASWRHIDDTLSSDDVAWELIQFQKMFEETFGPFANFPSADNSSDLRRASAETGKAIGAGNGENRTAGQGRSSGSAIQPEKPVITGQETIDTPMGRLKLYVRPVTPSQVASAVHRNHLALATSLQLLIDALDRLLVPSNQFVLEDDELIRDIRQRAEEFGAAVRATLDAGHGQAAETAGRANAFVTHAVAAVIGGIAAAGATEITKAGLGLIGAITPAIASEVGTPIHPEVLEALVECSKRGGSDG